MKKVALGITAFEDIIGRNVFYVDKTRFIKDWYDSADQVTLITRPRRFGKTLTLNMVETFFSVRYQDRMDLFDGLFIAGEERFRAMQGTFPVINLSLANIKQSSYESMCCAMRIQLARLFERHSYLLKSEKVSDAEKALFSQMLWTLMDFLVKRRRSSGGMMVFSLALKKTSIIRGRF